MFYSKPAELQSRYWRSVLSFFPQFAGGVRYSRCRNRTPDCFLISELKLKSKIVRKPRGKVMTLARWVCRLFLASAVSDIRPVKATLTLLNWFHISLDVVFSRISISSLSLWDAARSLWDRRMLSSVNLDHESGRDSLREKTWHGEDHSLILSSYPCGYMS